MVVDMWGFRKLATRTEAATDHFSGGAVFLPGNHPLLQVAQCFQFLIPNWTGLKKGYATCFPLLGTNRNRQECH